MAHFAQIDENNQVTRVLVVNNEDIMDLHNIEGEEIGIGHLKKEYGVEGRYIQCSYNGVFRGNYPGVGHTYMENVQTLGVASTDIFIRPQPYPSWTGISTTTAEWVPPAGPNPLTDDERAEGKYYIWDESSTSWSLRTSD